VSEIFCDSETTLLPPAPVLLAARPANAVEVKPLIDWFAVPLKVTVNPLLLNVPLLVQLPLTPMAPLRVSVPAESICTSPYCVALVNAPDCISTVPVTLNVLPAAVTPPPPVWLIVRFLNVLVPDIVCVLPAPFSVTVLELPTVKAAELVQFPATETA